MGYEDELVRGICKHCGRPAELRPGVGWVHSDDDGFGRYMYTCPRCGPFVTEYHLVVCSCGERVVFDHEAEF